VQPTAERGVARLEADHLQALTAPMAVEAESLAQRMSHIMVFVSPPNALSPCSGGPVGENANAY